MNYPSPHQFIWIAVIAAIAPTLSSVAALVVAVRTTEKVAIVETKIEQVHKATNSMKDALVASTRKESLQEGHIAGVKEGRAEGRAAGRIAGIAEEKAADAAALSVEKKKAFWR